MGPCLIHGSDGCPDESCAQWRIGEPSEPVQPVVYEPLARVVGPYRDAITRHLHMAIHEAQRQGRPLLIPAEHFDLLLEVLPPWNIG